MSDDRVPDVSPDLPSTTWRLALAALARLPQGALSRSFGALADTPLPRPLRRVVLGTFARALGIDAAQAERPITDYGSINEFFVRKLKPGTRPWPGDPTSAGSPVEGIVGQLGRVESGALIQAKGRIYSAARLLDDEVEARRFDHGSYITLYLSPRHYHRIHAPMTGEIVQARHIPGQLLPVNAPSVAHISDLFATNERLACYIDTAVGRVAVVAVGAYNVGRISASFDNKWSPQAWVTNRRGVRAETRTYDPSIHVRAGDEIMAFHLGSTVVLLFEDPSLRLRGDLRPGDEVALGQQLALPAAHGDD